MDTLLTPETGQRIIECGLRFDGYKYAKATMHGRDEHDSLNTLLQQLKGTGKLFSNEEGNLAANFYLHRQFHFTGELPSAYSPDWYLMIFLYLHLYRTKVPVKFRHSGSYTMWENREKGSAEKAATEIRRLLMRR